MTIKTLEPKQKRFCKEYMIDMNATQAAIRAGYSKKTANEQGARLLAKVSVKAEIERLQEKLRSKFEITTERVLAELARVGFSNVKKYLESNNEITDISELPDDIAAAVESVTKSVTTFEGGSKEKVQFKLHNKVLALEKLGRHLGIFEKDNNQSKPQVTLFKVYKGIDTDKI